MALLPSMPWQSTGMLTEVLQEGFQMGSPCNWCCAALSPLTPPGLPSFKQMSDALHQCLTPQVTPTLCYDIKACQANRSSAVCVFSSQLHHYAQSLFMTLTSQKAEGNLHTSLHGQPCVICEWVSQVVTITIRSIIL